MDPIWTLLTRNIKAVNFFFFFPPHSYRPINRVASKRSVCQKCSSCSPHSAFIHFPEYSLHNFLYSKQTIKIPAKEKKVSHGGLYIFIWNLFCCHTFMHTKSTQYQCTSSCPLSNIAHHPQSFFFSSQPTKVWFEVFSYSCKRCFHLLDLWRF